MTIRSRLIVWFIVVTGTSLILLTIVATNNAIQTLHEETKSALNVIAKHKIELIYDYIHEKESLIAAEADQPLIMDAMEHLAKAYKVGISSQAYRIKDAMYRSFLNSVKNRIDSYDIFLVSPEGDVVYTDIHESDFATNLRTGLYRTSQLAKVFEKAATLLETTLSPFEYYLPSHEPRKAIGLLEKTQLKDNILSAFIAAPIFREDRFLGVLVLQLRSDDFFYLSDNYLGLKNTGEVVITQLDKNDVIFIAPLRHNRNKNLDLRIPVGSESAFPAQEAVLGRKGLGITKDYGDVPIVAAWQYVPELQWGVVVKINADEAFSAERQLKYQLLVTGVIILLGAIIIAIYIAHRLTEPIRELVLATRRITLGELSYQIKINTIDEVGDLAAAFNKMSISLLAKMTAVKITNIALEKSNQELDSFAYVASHDLKSPLRGLGQLVCWVEEDIDDKKETAAHLLMMRKRIHRMEALLDDLLAYSRVGREDEKNETIDSKDILESIFEMVAPPEKFTLELQGAFPRFNTVKTPFQIVFRNLISNSIKHHDKEDGLISISVEVDDNFYIYHVSDDGPGIDPLYHKKIFNLFQTLKSKDEVEGSGMGLAIIKKITQSFGGDIKVMSVKDEGACFTVWWPKLIKQANENSQNRLEQ